MATTEVTWFGARIHLDSAEAQKLLNALNTGNGGVAGIAGVLAAFGVTGPVSVVAGAVNAVLTLGSTALSNCNGQQRGVVLNVLWVGLPWCRSK